jgi:hypothetical protein
MFLTLFVISIYTREVYIKLETKRNRESVERTQGVFNILDFNRSTSSQLIYLSLIYMKYPIFLLLVMSGLAKMDLYHVLLLFIFVWAALYP